jgi:hypothetical protein
MRAAIVILLSAYLASCARGSVTAPAAPASATVCARKLAPRSAPRAPLQAQPPALARPSRLIVDARLALAKLASELERNVQPQLAAATGVELGLAGVLDYDVQRGPFSLSISNDKLVIDTPVSGRAQACKGQRCYAACEPRALVRAEIPLWLRPDYRFDRSRVSLEFTQGCKVRVFGGLVSIDVTRTLKSALAPQLERVGREIDERLPDVRAHVERAWRELSRPRALPFGGCVVVEPRGLVQGPVHEANGMAHARFALLARPELRSDCSTSPEAAADGTSPISSVPLPPLSADPALPEEDALTLGLELPLASLARAFEAAAPDASSGVRFRVSEATVAALGRRVDAELTLSGELCGAVALQAQPSFAGEAGLIELTAGQLDATDSERVRSAGIDPAALAAQLARSPRLATPVSLQLLRAAPTALAALFPDAEFSLSARISSLRAAGAAARADRLVAWVEARGSLVLEHNPQAGSEKD